MVYADEPEGDADSGDRVRIGGDPDCNHELRRVGSDGGYNIYFECTNCEAGVVKFSEIDDATEDYEEALPRDPPSSGGPSHPLIEGLTLSSNGHNGDGEESVLDRIESSLRDIFGDDRDR